MHIPHRMNLCFVRPVFLTAIIPITLSACNGEAVLRIRWYGQVERIQNQTMPKRNATAVEEIRKNGWPRKNGETRVKRIIMGATVTLLLGCTYVGDSLESLICFAVLQLEVSRSLRAAWMLLSPVGTSTCFVSRRTLQILLHL